MNNIKNNRISFIFYASKFDEYFLTEKYRTSFIDNFRNRYEVTMPEIDYWINNLGLELSNDFDNSGQKFKNNLFYHLKKLGWRPTKIKGRWSKTVFI